MAQRLRLEITTPTTYDLIGGWCVEQLSLRVYGTDPRTAVAESTPGSGDTCFTLRHTFAPGSYSLVLSKTNDTGCATDGDAGNTSLRLAIVR